MSLIIIFAVFQLKISNDTFRTILMGIANIGYKCDSNQTHSLQTKNYTSYERTVNETKKPTMHMMNVLVDEEEGGEGEWVIFSISCGIHALHGIA